MSSKEVIIYGCGMSGLIAAVDLARHGYKVIVHDREKEYGTDPRYNPSVHTTPVDIMRTSRYIGIDISSAFNPLLRCPVYFHDTCIQLPVNSVYAVERGNRKTSLDTLLLDIAITEGVEFEFNSELTLEKIQNLPENTIIACGLREDAYQLLDIPYIPCYGWCSIGECGFSDYAWIWLDECITEYGYMTATNNLYFDLLFSLKPVSPEALQRYKSFCKRNEGVEHDNWRYLVGGVVPMAKSDNPRLHHKGLILCGTISGFMDPFAWFGILGGMISGKVAAMAVYNPQAAQQEFARLNKNFKTTHFLKSHIWTKIRPQVNMMEKTFNLIGTSRFNNMASQFGSLFMSGGAKPIPYPYLITDEIIQNIQRASA